MFVARSWWFIHTVEHTLIGMLGCGEFEAELATLASCLDYGVSSSEAGLKLMLKTEG